MSTLPRVTEIRGPYGDRPDAFQPDAPDKGTLGDGFIPVTPDHLVPVNDDTLQGTSTFYGARQERIDRKADQENGFFTSLAAGLYQSPGVNILRRLTAPSFENDPPINKFEYLEQLPITLTKDEREMFDKYAKGAESAKWIIGEIRTNRGVNEIAGDNPGAAVLGGFLDPANFVPVVGAGARVGKGLLGRAAMAGIVGANNVAIDSVGLTPRTSEDYLLDALIGGTVGFLSGGQAIRQVKAHIPGTPVAAPTVTPVHQGTIQQGQASAQKPPAPTAPPSAAQPGSPVAPTAAPVPPPEAVIRPDNWEVVQDPIRFQPTASAFLEAPQNLWEDVPRLNAPTGRLEAPRKPLLLSIDIHPTEAPKGPVAAVESPSAASLEPDRLIAAREELASTRERLAGIRDGSIKAQTSKTQAKARLKAKIERLENEVQSYEESFVRREQALRDPILSESRPLDNLEQRIAEASIDPPAALEVLTSKLKRAADDPKWAKRQGKQRLAAIQAEADAITEAHNARQAAVAREVTAKVKAEDRLWQKRRATAEKRYASALDRYRKYGSIAKPAKPASVRKSEPAAKPTAHPPAPGSVVPVSDAVEHLHPSEVLGDVAPEYIDLGSLDSEVRVTSFNGDRFEFTDANEAATQSSPAAIANSGAVHQGSAGQQQPKQGPVPTPAPAAPGKQGQANPAGAGGSGGNGGSGNGVTAAGAVGGTPPSASIAQVLANGASGITATPSSTVGKFASKIAWNIHKTMSKFGPAGKTVADLLYDNVLEPGKVSVESERAAILSDLESYQKLYEDKLLQTMQERGYGLAKRITSPVEAFEAQKALEKEVYREMVARNNAQHSGVAHTPTTTDAAVIELADHLDNISRQSLDELKRSGVQNADGIKEAKGFVSRKWASANFEAAVQRMNAMGIDGEKELVRLISEGIAKRTPLMPPQVLKEMAEAIKDRALRKGYFEDNIGQGTPPAIKAFLVDSMEKAGMTSSDIHAVLRVLEKHTDQHGGSGYLKSRIGIDLEHSITLPDGSTISGLDLVDTNISQLTDLYLKRVATDAAFARKGLGRQSDIIALREHLLHSIPSAERYKAAELFDNSIAYFKGLPQGAAMNENFRRVSSYGRAITLAWSGLWQLVEFGTTLGQYGLVAATKLAAGHVPGFNGLFDARNAESIVHALSEHSARSVRLRPFLTRFEDGHGIGSINGVDLNLQQLGNLVPYANGMKWVHHSQAKLTANLLTHRLEKAIKGDAKALKELHTYGIDDAVIDKVRQEYNTHGLDIDAWNGDAWDAVRPGLYRAMDSAIVKGRLGDVPAFAAFDPVGRTLFTYRSFILAAHNKTLAGTLATSGLKGLGLIIMYQFPLALLATYAQNIITGREQDDPAASAVSQIGAIGLFTEPFKWITGQSNSVGAPVLIPFDRGIKVLQGAASLDPGETASRAVDMIPIVAANPVIKGISQHLKN